MYFAASEELQRSFAAKDAAQDDNIAGRHHLSADTRQLLAAQHVDDAVAADSALQHDRPSGSLFHFPHADRAF